MLKIGDFSKMGRVTVKTLRFWDEIGLLRPDHVNEENGYRYYSSAKLALVHEIRSMKELGLYLEENGYEIADKPRESYIDGIWNRENPDDWRTEIQIPVRKAD